MLLMPRIFLQAVLAWLDLHDFGVTSCLTRVLLTLVVLDDIDMYVARATCIRLWNANIWVMGVDRASMFTRTRALCDFLVQRSAAVEVYLLTSACFARSRYPPSQSPDLAASFVTAVMMRHGSVGL